MGSALPKDQQSLQHTVICDDAVSWLQNSPVLSNCSTVASLPDISEFPKFNLEQWSSWFIETAKLILSRTPENGVSIFYQSDIKLNGNWIDKGYLCQRAAEGLEDKLLWHKIACRLPPGNLSFGRPGFSHLLCFSKGVKISPANSIPDVIPEIGQKLWSRGMGIKVCQMIAKFIASETSTNTVVNPFCGYGTMLAAASLAGLSTIGIERSRKRAEIARESTKLEVS